jgi:ribosome biogenesis GTPase A
MLGNKKHIIVLNKRDLADAQYESRVLAHFQREGIMALYVDTRESASIKRLLDLVKQNVTPKYKSIPAC